MTHSWCLFAVVEKLRSQLRERAEELSGQVDLPVDIGKAVGIVKLQLSTCDDVSLDQLDDIGNFSRRSDYSAIYETLRDDIALIDIFDFARRKAESEGPIHCTTDAAREKWFKRALNRILILGQAGIGKTVITKIIAGLVLRSEIQPNCEYLFYIRFRDIDFESRRTLLEILISGSGCEWNFTAETSQLLWEQFKSNPNVLIILDGLDEAGSTDVLKISARCNPLEKEKVSSQLTCLISGASLPEAKVVVTSRLREGNELHNEVRPRTVLQVLGLNEDAQKQLGKEICGEKWDDVKMYLEENPQIQAICYVPVICVLVMFSLYSGLFNSGQMKLNSLTRVLLSALINFVDSEFMRENVSELKKLSSLAWRGFCKRKLLFDACDLLKADIHNLPPQSILFTHFQPQYRFKILSGGSKKHFFSHMVWLEIFASVHVLLYASDAIFTKTMKKLKRSRWEVVAKCLFGLCNQEVLPALRHLFPDADFSNLRVRKQSLKQLLANTLQNTSRSHQHSQARFERIVTTCSWMREMDDSKITREIAEFLPRTITLSGDIFPADVSSLNYALQMRSGYNEITFNVRFRSVFMGKSLFLLFDGISKADNISVCIFVG